MDFFNRKKVEELTKENEKLTTTVSKQQEVINILNEKIDLIVTDLTSKYKDRYFKLIENEESKQYHIDKITSQSGLVMLELSDGKGGHTMRFLEPTKLKTLIWISKAQFEESL